MERRLLLVAASSLAILMLLGESPQYRDISEIYPPECGKRPAMDKEVSETKITGGHDAKPGAWPWQVSLQAYSMYYGYEHFCSGILITHNSVLTAAHCIKTPNDPQRYRIMAGLHNMEHPGQYTVTANVYEVVMHVNYSKANSQDDIAMLFLEKKLIFNLYTQPICLPKANLPVLEKYPCYISGWGQTHIMGPPASTLQEAQVELISHHICNSEDWYAGILTPNMLCAGYEEGGVSGCVGDDGGPLMCFYPDSSRFFLLGINIFGHGCGERKAPSVFTFVPGYRKWMDLLLVSHEATPMSIPQALNVWIIGWVTLHLVL